jgi:tRNA nucleotidyltransferase (CCA-adding enzyme)
MPNKKTPFLRDRPELPDQVMEIIRAIAAEGGQTLLVGGYVRDLAADTNSTSKDLDLEVHRLTLDQVEALLGRFGEVDLVGRQFGVFRLHGLDVDWSVPRKDSHGRRPEVTPDPWMGIEEAARRRDLTINSMAIDPLENTFFDPYNGMADMEQGLLRATDSKLFVEDPLRFFRVMSFAARMEMRVEPRLTALCAAMDLHDVARERIDDEFTKLFLRSRRPSLGLRWIDATGRLDEILPEVGRIKGVEQDPEWHPEGDVWKHTLQVVDAAAALRIDDKEQDLMLLWAALGHDLGKAETTLVLDGRIRSPVIELKRVA